MSVDLFRNRIIAQPTIINHSTAWRIVVTTPRISSHQYIVEFPNVESATRFWPRGQSVELALSTSLRKVAALSAAQVETLRQVPGVQVYLNRRISIPHGEHRHAVRTDRLDAHLKIGVPTHGADKLQAAGITGTRAFVAVIDTGIAPHKDLHGSDDVKRFYDVVAGQEVAPYDDHGHGTHCSGIVSASGGITGMAPDASLIGIKVLDHSGYGTTATVMAGIDKAIEYFKAGYRPLVISMSLGDDALPIADDPLVAKVKEAADLGIYFAIAAGNSGPSKGTIGSPGTTNHPRVLTVAAFDTRGTVEQSDDRIASFSSVGDMSKPELGQDAMDVGADGVSVLSLAPKDRYTKMSGTSMATPFVAGALALVMDLAYKLAAEGKLKVSPEEINFAELLKESANDHPKIDEIKEGKGELQVDKAAELLVQKYGV
jgi:serine protease AprX